MINGFFRNIHIALFILVFFNFKCKYPQLESAYIVLYHSIPLKYQVIEAIILP